MKGKYTIELLDGGTVPLWFSTWSFKKFAQGKGLSVDELIQYIVTGTLKSEDMALAMLTAAENEAIERGQPFNYTERDADKWIDALGGLFGEKLKQVVIVMIVAIFDKDPTEAQKDVKIEPVKKKGLVGRNSTQTRHRRGSGRGK